MEHHDDIGSGVHDGRFVCVKSYDLESIAYFSKLAIIAAKAISEIRDCGGKSPYFRAVEHCILHVANGGTLDNFKPLVRTSSYAGIDRRQTKNTMH